MDDFLTSEQVADRTARAVDAAVRAGRDLGLTVTDAEVLYDVFSVVVRLAPAPVVARVPTVLPPHVDLAGLARRQQAELDVARWLADRDVPVIAPSPLVPPDPVRRDGHSMTFWRYVEQLPGHEPDYVANAGLVADLHAAMRAYPGRLTFLSAAEPQFIDDSLALLDGRPELIAPADLARALDEWRILAPAVRSRAVFDQTFPGVDLQPIHGDCPAANIVAGVDGHLFADFELVTLGPVEWDLAGVGADGEAGYDDAARRIGLRPLDVDVLRFVNAVGMLRGVACLALAPQLPMLVEAVAPLLDQWRSTPPYPGAG